MRHVTAASQTTGWLQEEPGLSRRQTLCHGVGGKKRAEVIPQTFRSSSVLCVALRGGGRAKACGFLLVNQTKTGKIHIRRNQSAIKEVYFYTTHVNCTKGSI